MSHGSYAHENLGGSIIKFIIPLSLKHEHEALNKQLRPTTQGDGEDVETAKTLAPLLDFHAPVSTEEAQVLGQLVKASDECNETQLLAATTASLSQPVIVIDPLHLIVTVNSAIEILFDYRVSELKGKPVSLLFTERDFHKQEQHILQLDKNGGVLMQSPHPFRITCRRADGSVFPAEATVVQIKQTAQPLLSVLLRDITEDVAAEKVLQTNYELLDRIFATTHFCIVDLDRDLNFVRVNRAYADSCGHPPEYFIGKNHFDLFPNQENQAIFREVVASGQPFTIYAKAFEYPGRPELGVTYWDWTLHPLKDVNGHVEGLLFALLDVTRQVRAMKELERKTALAQLLEGLARAVNEAQTPEDAMHRCLSQLCVFGQWRLGRITTSLAPCGGHTVPADSIWQGADLGPYENFIRASQDIDASSKSGQFSKLLLRENKAVWIADLDQAQGFVRRAAALADGLRCAFAFPVLMQGLPVAYLEFFADNVRPVDQTLIAAAEVIGVQIVHLIERSRAAQRQAQLAVIVENSIDAIFSYGIDGKLLTWNAAAERLFGYSAEEVSGQGFVMLVPAEERAAAALRVEQVLNGIEVPSYEGVRLGKGGRRIEFAGSMSPIRDLNGNVSGISMNFRDVSERRRAQQERALLAAIVESSNDAILMRGLDRSILSWNTAAEQLFGWSMLEAVGQPIDLIVPPECRESMHRFTEGAARDMAPNSVQTTHLRKDGTRILTQVTFSPVKDSKGEVIAHSYTVRDISELKQKEKALRDSYWRQRLLSQRLRSVEEAERRAIARELHDRIGQDLSSVGLLLASLGAMLPTSSRDAVESPLNVIQGLLKSMSANVRDILAELRPPALDDYGLLAALRHLATEFSQRTRIAIDLDGVDLLPRLSSVVETTMLRISQEALSNVAKHAGANHVVINLHADADLVILQIADNGSGFDTNRIMPAQRHWGLSTMRERAEEAGIAFMVESKPGAGTRVVLEIKRVTT